MKIIQSFLIFLIAINHGSASNLHKTDEKDSFYQIKWMQKADLPMPVLAPGIAVIDNRIYVIGGCDKEFKEYSSVYEATFQSPSTTNMDSTRQKENLSP